MNERKKRLVRRIAALLAAAILLITTGCASSSEPSAVPSEFGAEAVTEAGTAPSAEPGTAETAESGATEAAESATPAPTEPPETEPAQTLPESEADDPEKEAAYQRALQQLDGKKYTAAITALRKLAGYKDSADLLLQTELAMLREAKPGDVILFGEGALNAGKKGPRPLSWTVLEKRRDKVLVVSQNLPGESMPYSTSGSRRWADSDVRTWLNGTYLESNFREEEQDRIRETYVTRGVNPYSGDVEEGSETVDRLFLLSMTEWEPFEELLNNVAFGSDPYWTRTPGREGRVLCAHGFSKMASEEDVKENAYVRPVMWIDAGEAPEPAPAALPPYDTKAAQVTDPGETVQGLILAQQENYPEGMLWVDSEHPDYSEEYEYDTLLMIRNADWDGNNFGLGIEHFYAEACLAFARRINDLVFGNMEVGGDGAILETEKDAETFFSRLRPGDIVFCYRENEPGHAFVVLLATIRYLVITEGNYNGTIHWGRVVTAKDMMEYIAAAYETRWPRFYLQPRDAHAAPGETVRFYATASEKPASCTWLISRDEGKNWFELKGEEQDPVLEFPAGTENDGWLFRCRLDYATGLVLYSEPARLKVAP